MDCSDFRVEGEAKEPAFVLLRGPSPGKEAFVLEMCHMCAFLRQICDLNDVAEKSFPALPSLSSLLPFFL